MLKQKYQKFITALLLCLSILLIVAGCSSDSAQKSNSTAAYTVTDSQGHKLYFKEKPQRIISMSISTDEILIDLVPSSRIAAFSRLVDDPGISNIVERAQSVGSRVDGQSSEAIMALHPDLILIPDFVKPEVIQSLRDMNLQVYVYKTPKSFEDVRECIRFLGEAVGEKERGEMMVTAMDEHLKKVQDKIGKIPKEKQKRIVLCAVTVLTTVRRLRLTMSANMRRCAMPWRSCIMISLVSSIRRPWFSSIRRYFYSQAGIMTVSMIRSRWRKIC